MEEAIRITEEQRERLNLKEIAHRADTSKEVNGYSKASFLI